VQARKVNTKQPQTPLYVAHIHSSHACSVKQSRAAQLSVAVRSWLCLLETGRLMTFWDGQVENGNPG